MASSETARFPCECPRCEAATGFPYRVQTDATNPYGVHVDLRCRRCHNEWHVDRSSHTSSSRDPEAPDGRAQAIPDPPPTASAADGPDFLDLPIAWTPSRRFGHGQVHEYRLALGADTVAILWLVPGKGWAMTIAHGTAQPDERGLFATPRDALMVLLAEFVMTDADAETHVGTADSPPAQIASGSDGSKVVFAPATGQHASLQSASRR